MERFLVALCVVVGGAGWATTPPKDGGVAALPVLDTDLAAYQVPLLDAADALLPIAKTQSGYGTIELDVPARS